MKKIARFLASKNFPTIDKVRVVLDKIDIKKIKNLVAKYNSKDLSSIQRRDIKADLDDMADDIKYIGKFMNYSQLKLQPAYKKVLSDALKII